jgi:hypothetical protein
MLMALVRDIRNRVECVWLQETMRNKREQNHASLAASVDLCELTFPASFSRPFHAEGKNRFFGLPLRLITQKWWLALSSSEFSFQGKF